MSQINYKIPEPISLNSSPETYLRQRDLDQLVLKRGYPVFLDHFMPCPCQESGTNAPKLTCKNCFGSGYVLTERVKTVASVTSINNPTQYLEWSEQNLGTVTITTMSRDPLYFMDRLVLYQDVMQFSELIYPRTVGSKTYAFLAYPPIEIKALKMFVSDLEPLQDLDISKVVIDKEGRIDLSDLNLSKRDNFVYNDKTTLSILYTYHPSYHVIDVNHQIRVYPTDTPSYPGINKGDRVIFPYNAIGRMSHLVLDRSNLMDLPEGMNNNGLKSTTSMSDSFKNNLDVSQEFCDTEKK